VPRPQRKEFQSFVSITRGDIHNIFKYKSAKPRIWLPSPRRLVESRSLRRSNSIFSNHKFLKFTKHTRYNNTTQHTRLKSRLGMDSSLRRPGYTGPPGFRRLQGAETLLLMPPGDAPTRAPSPVPAAIAPKLRSHDHHPCARVQPRLCRTISVTPEIKKQELPHEHTWT
jgi:hypothetical protein